MTDAPHIPAPLRRSLEAAAKKLDLYERVNEEVEAGKPWEQIENGFRGQTSEHRYSFDYWDGYMESALRHALYDIVYTYRAASLASPTAEQGGVQRAWDTLARETETRYQPLPAGEHPLAKEWLKGRTEDSPRQIGDSVDRNKLGDRMAAELNRLSRPSGEAGVSRAAHEMMMADRAEIVAERDRLNAELADAEARATATGERE